MIHLPNFLFVSLKAIASNSKKIPTHKVFKTSAPNMSVDKDLSYTPICDHVSEGFLGVIQEMVNMCNRALHFHFREKYFDEKRMTPSIQIQLIAENEGPAIVAKRYQNNRYCRLFQLKIRISGYGFKQDSVQWS